MKKKAAKSKKGKGKAQGKGLASKGRGAPRKAVTKRRPKAARTPETCRKPVKRKPKTKPSTGGRREIIFDKEMFEDLCFIQCTQEEVAAFLGMSVDSLEKKVPEHYEGRTLSDVFAEKREGGHISLRRLQWQSAKKNFVMQMFLGKQYLGQSDKSDVNFKDRTDYRKEAARIQKAKSGKELISALTDFIKKTNS